MTDAPREVRWRRPYYKTSYIHLTLDGLTTLCGKPVRQPLIDVGSGTRCGTCQLAVAGPDARAERVQLAARINRGSGRGRLRYTDEDLVAEIRRFAEEVNGGETPSVKEWERFGPAVGAPAAATVVNRFGTWSTAMAAAGLAPNRGTGPGHARRFAREDAVAALRACADERGRLPSYQEYERWQAANRPQRGKGGHGAYPSGATVRYLLGGSWGRALEELVSQRPAPG